MEIQVRDAFPPFAHRFTFDASGKYGLTISKMDTADFGLGRGDPAVTMLEGMMPGRKRVGQFVSIVRDDGLFPWAGWVTKYDAVPGGTVYPMIASDPGFLLKYARSSKQKTYTGNGGAVISEMIRDASVRYVLPINLDRIATTGDYLDYTPNAKPLLSCISEVARMSDSEWWWEFDVTPFDVTIYLRFEKRRGSDKRGSAIWLESQQLIVGKYSQDAEGFFNEVLVVGGRGDFENRPAASVTPSGVTADGATGSRLGSGPSLVDGSPIFQGTQTVINRSVNDQGALARAGFSYAETPEEFGEQLSGSIVEGSTDMTAFGVGDIITVKLLTADLGVPVDLPVRIMGLQFDPDSGTHDVEMMVRQDLIG